MTNVQKTHILEQWTHTFAERKKNIYLNDESTLQIENDKNTTVKFST